MNTINKSCCLYYIFVSIHNTLYMYLQEQEIS